MIKIGIIGSRRRDSQIDFLNVADKFRKVYEVDDWIVSGGCPEGGDHFAELVAKDMGVPILIFYPNWLKFKKAAGFVRNGDIAKNSTVLIACVAADRKGGTEDTIKKFLKDKKMTEAEAIQDCFLYLV